MSADQDFLICLAAVRAGLLSPEQLPADSSHAVATILKALCDEQELAALRLRTSELTRLAAWDLARVLDDLSRQLVHTDIEGTRADTKTTGAGTVQAATGDISSVSIEEAGRYKFAREHARGGMGRVMVVYDRYLTRRIALKELSPQSEDTADGTTLDASNCRSDPATVQRQAHFLYEARITGQLEHPSIVPVYEVGRRENGTLYYTMRLIKGRSLRQAIQEARTLEKRLRLLPHFINLCQAIAYAHSRDVVHRDIKPSNVMVGEFGETVVIDWGLAKASGYERDSEEVDARPGAAVGTPAYMSPEQAAGSVDSIDERSDVYSLGAVLYELLTGVAPFPDATPAKALAKLLAGVPPPVNRAVPGAPEQLMAICDHAMARDPRYRYQTAKELSTDIERFLSGRLVGVYDYNVRELFIHFVQSFKAPLIVGAIGVLALCGTVYVGYAHTQKERDRAITESIRALNAEEEALAAQNIAEQEFYFAAILSVRKYIIDGRYEKAMEQLDKCPERFRHWEWGYLLYLCNLDQRSFPSHEPETVWSLAYSPDGLHAFSAGFDNRVRIWDTNSGAEVGVYEGAERTSIEVSPHPFYPILACAEEGGHVTLYDYEKNEVVYTWKPSNDDVNCIQFHPDGSVFVTGDDDGILRMWNYETRTEQYAIPAENGAIDVALFSIDGSLIASSDRSGEITLRESETGATVRRLAGPKERTTALAFSSRENILASASRDATIRIWDLDTGIERQTLRGHGTSAVWAVAFSPDGKMLASSGSDLTVRLWNTETWVEERVYRGHQKQVDCLAFSPDGSALLSGDDGGMIKQWDTHFPGTQLDQWALRGHTGMINHIVYSPDGEIAVTAAGHWRRADDKTARVWDANSGTLITVLEGHTASVRHTAFNHDGQVYATSSHDGTVRLWDRESYQCTGVLGPFESGVNTTAFSPTSPRALSVGLRDGTVLLVDWASGAILEKKQEHEEEVLGLAYSPDGRWLVSSGADEVAQVLDGKTLARVATLAAHGARVPTVAFSPDGSWLATGGHDWKIHLWNTTTWEHTHILEGHTQGIYSVAFSEDGRRLLSSASDGASILWDMATYREVLQIEGWVSAIRPGSQDILTGTRDVNAYVWPAFPWSPDTYGDIADGPLSARVEAFKRAFWQSRRLK